MSKKVSKDANKAKVKTANDKRGVIILCLIAFIVILVIAAVILAFIYLGTVKKSNPDKLSSDVANEIRQDEYVVMVIRKYLKSCRQRCVITTYMLLMIIMSMTRCIRTGTISSFLQINLVIPMKILRLIMRHYSLYITLKIVIHSILISFLSRCLMKPVVHITYFTVLSSTAIYRKRE